MTNPQAARPLPWLQISAETYQSWLDQHELIEQDRFGPKVLRCSNGDYIKLFRIKHRFSLARLFNPARRFCRNAHRLQAMGIPTVQPVALMQIPQLERWAVRYTPLEGETLRHLIRQFALPAETISHLGQFIARLHELGVLFRSLHPGNVVLMPDGRIGLIDVLDCRFTWFGRPLTDNQRRRNFRHFFRYEDGKLLREPLLAAYEQMGGALPG